MKDSRQARCWVQRSAKARLTDRHHVVGSVANLDERVRRDTPQKARVDRSRAALRETENPVRRAARCEQLLIDPAVQKRAQRHIRPNASRQQPEHAQPQQSSQEARSKRHHREPPRRL